MKSCLSVSERQKDKDFINDSQTLAKFSLPVWLPDKIQSAQLT